MQLSLIVRPGHHYGSFISVVAALRLVRLLRLVNVIKVCPARLPQHLLPLLLRAAAYALGHSFACDAVRAWRFKAVLKSMQ